MQSCLTVVEQLAAVTVTPMRNFVVLAIVFSVAARVFASCNPGAPWWRKPDLSTDICYAFVPRLLVAYGQTALLVVGMALFYGFTEQGQAESFVTGGRGPLSGLPFWGQVGAYLLGGDLVMYVTHRGFHTVHLWRFHAVHHSSETLEWVSAFRFHPVDQLLHSGLSDVVMMLLGVSPEVLVWMAPWNAGTSALAHANLAWDFGPFRTVLVSPVFHRWHHTGADEGGRSNFAGTFPVIDLMFGTFYMPRERRPDGYGVDEPDYPTHFFGQIVAPFRPKAKNDRASEEVHRA